jgi:hypothetical protein
MAEKLAYESAMEKRVKHAALLQDRMRPKPNKVRLDTFVNNAND